MIVTAMHDATQQSVIVKNLCETANIGHLLIH